MIGHLEVIRLLGRGGMGQVYLARDTRLGRLVALKFVVETTPTLTRRFITEARATAQLTHENIVCLYDIGEYERALYMVLEYFKGQTLKDWLEARALQRADPSAAGFEAIRTVLSPHHVVDLMLPVVRALVSAHQAGIVHRDLKPSNIMLSDSGQVKVLDFGIAKLLRASERPPPPARTSDQGEDRERADGTQYGEVIGTFAYMSPEQWGAGAVDERSDLWAIGIILFQLATGRHPLTPVSQSKLMTVVDLDLPMPSVRELRGDLGRLAPIIDRCLIKRKEDRIESARTLLSELESIASPQVHIDGDKENPYSGLSSFQEGDADRFFGRERAVAEVVARVAEQPLVVIVGASGAGKSSFVRAGVIPTLKRGTDAWEAFILRPGPRPLVALADLLSQHSWLHSTQSHAHSDPSDSSSSIDPSDGATLADRLAAQPGLLGAELRARARRRLERIVLFIDQFEELYTLATPHERQAFFACLAGTADDLGSPLRVVVSMRSDFLDRMADAPPAILDGLSRNTILIRPLDRNGLQSALVKPAEGAGYRFESDAMVEEMIEALDNTQGALPILQFTAAKLWERRDTTRRALTVQSYREIGGVAGALATHADAVLSAMRSSERQWARLLLLRLVTPERTRAICSLKDLRDLAAQAGGEIDSVLARLIEARLLAIEGSNHDESAVEIVHESLIVQWPRLSQWLDEDKNDSHFVARLRRAAKDWEAGGRAAGLLWTSEAADEGRRWYDRYRQSPGASIGRREEEYLEEVIRRLLRARSRRRSLIGGALALLSTVVALTSYLAWEQTRAKRAAERAAQVAESAILEARDAARISAGRLQADDPTTQLALLRDLEGTKPPPGWAAQVKEVLHAGVAISVMPGPEATYSLAVSPDDRRVVMTYLNGAIWARNLDGSGDAIVIGNHAAATNDVAFSPDGSTIVSASTDKTVRLWAADGSGERRVLDGHTAAVWSVSFSPDGARIASGSVDKTVRVWTLDDSAAPLTLTGHEDVVTGVSFAPDGTRIASASKDGTVRVWNADGSGRPLVLKGHSQAVNAVAFSPDGRRIASGGDDQSVRIWSADGKGEPLVLSGHSDGVNGVAFSPTGDRVAAASSDRTVRIWNSDGSGSPIVLKGHTADVFRVAFTHDGKRALSASEDRMTRVWNLDDPRAPLVLTTQSGSAWNLVFSPDGRRVVAGSRDKLVQMWNADGSGSVRTFAGHTGTVHGVAISPDGRRIASGSGDLTVRIWDIDGTSSPLVLKGHTASVFAVTFSRDNRFVASASDDHTVRVWHSDASGQPIVLPTPERNLGLAFSPDGSHLAVTSNQNILVWNTAMWGEPVVLRGDEARFINVAFSPDGRRIASGASNSTIHIWNLDGNETPLVLRGHGADVNAVTFSPDGLHLASGSDDQTLRIWSFDHPTDPIIVTADVGPIFGIAYSPDGNRLASSSGDATIRIWRDLAPVTFEDPILWRATDYCLSTSRQQQLLLVSEQIARNLEARCRSRIARERGPLR